MKLIDLISDGRCEYCKVTPNGMAIVCECLELRSQSLLPISSETELCRQSDWEKCPLNQTANDVEADKLLTEIEQKIRNEYARHDIKRYKGLPLMAIQSPKFKVILTREQVRLIKDYAEKNLGASAVCAHNGMTDTIFGHPIEERGDTPYLEPI